MTILFFLTIIQLQKIYAKEAGFVTLPRRVTLRLFSPRNIEKIPFWLIMLSYRSLQKHFNFLCTTPIRMQSGIM